MTQLSLTLLQESMHGFAPTLATAGETFSRAAVFALIVVAVLVAVGIGRRLRRAAKTPDGERQSRGERLVEAGYVISAAALGVTSLTAILSHGGMHSWWLFAHMTAAGAFLVFLTAACFLGLWRLLATHNRFHSTPCNPLVRSGILLCSIVVMATILLSMLPWAGTPHLELLIAVHRYSGLFLLLLIAAAFSSRSSRG